ncbi:ABC transporter substrate-binding protein [uncultured Cohaesibacter sp.]|uniref:ABC transporter substrate-binding protein n=1 Tax=uncultured Cohaesibacter sp. TaxID=1002546 RepID=UPI002AAB293C|nr:ABC transporter substrate-binding protein [uncultured Cohaesibacter sp.]
MKFKTLLQAAGLATMMAFAPMTGQAATPDNQLVIGVSLVTMVSLDPGAMSGRQSVEVNSNVYDTLITADASQKGLFHPSLSTSWELNEARDQITFHLRDDVKFHSGNPLTSKDFVFSMKRAMELGIGGSNVRVFGYSKDNIDAMVQAPDDYTVIVKFPKPTDPNLILGVIAGKGVAMVIDSKLALEYQKDGDYGQAWLTTHSAGSGAFKLDRWEANNLVILTRNDDYWGGKAAMKRIIYRHMPESQTLRLALEQHDIDIAWGMAVSDLKSLQKNDDLIKAEVPSGHVFYLAMSMKDEKYANKKVREAVRHLIDYEGINNTILPFTGTLYQRPIPAGLPGALPNPMYKYDPDLAKKLLSEAGYPDGFKTSIRVLSTSPFVNVATALQASLAKGGIEVEILTGNGDQVYGAMKARDYEMIVGRGGDRTGAHPYTSLLSIVYNPDNSDEAKLYTLQAWRTSFQDTTINEQLQAALLEPDEGKQKDMYADIQRRFEEDIPAMQIISMAYDTVVYQKDIKEYVGHPYQNTQYLAVTKQR